MAIFALLGAISYGESVQDQAGYPAWFWHPPDPDGSSYAVGFLQPCLDNDSSLALAKSIAIWNVLSQSKIRVSTVSGIAGTNPNIIYMGQDVQFRIDSLGYDGIYDDYVILDKHYIGYDYLLTVLVGPKSDSADFADRNQQCDYGDWTHEIPHDNENLYSMGSAPEYYYQSSSWKEALKNALVEMAHQISSEIKSLYKYEGHNVYKTVLEEGDVFLMNWWVAARKYNPENKTYNVLIKMPVSNGH